MLSSMWCGADIVTCLRGPRSGRSSLEVSNRDTDTVRSANFPQLHVSRCLGSRAACRSVKCPLRTLAWRRPLPSTLASVCVEAPEVAGCLWSAGAAESISSLVRQHILHHLHSHSLGKGGEINGVPSTAGNLPAIGQYERKNAVPHARLARGIQSVCKRWGKSRRAVRNRDHG